MVERRLLLYARETSGNFGGVESQIDRLADAAAAKGVLEPALLTTDAASLLARRFVAKGRRVFVAPLGRLDAPLAAGRLARLVDPASIAAVESHMLKESFVGRALKRRWPGVAHAFRAHTYVDCSWIPEWRKRAYHLADRLTSGGVDIYLANGRAVADEIVRRSGVDAAKVEIVLNGCDAPGGAQAAAWDSAEPAAPLVAMVANLVERKGHDTLVRALALLSGRGRRVRARLVGSETADPAQTARVRALAAGLGVADLLDFAGFSESVGPALAGVPVVVLPSDAEGLPLSILEAMSVGRIVVASRVGAVPECVTDGRDGFLHEPGDAAALAAVLERIFTTPAAALKPVSDAARETWRARFRVETMIGEFSRLYRERLGLEAY
ncbi:MAG: glycosyltransferase family 4 protein [Elusimicrobiota bacterium]|nr:MAG: glycosyltransferase family 4 protein [Elusimicrobiota bacterium]